jgi:hypothetical protein
MKTAKHNEFKTSDISITKDREGFFNACHKYQGDLIVTGYYSDRAECRRDAVRILQEMKEQA